MAGGARAGGDEGGRAVRTLTRGILVGHGGAAFEAASEHLLTWGVHRDAGLHVSASAPRAVLGATVTLTLGHRPLRVVAPCVVVGVLAEACDRGFTYETLPGHPERGVQHFRVTMAPDGTVRGVVHSESAPASLLARAGGPLTHLVQQRQVDRYLRAMRGAARARRAAGQSG